jgi:hypothetical protein
MKPLKIEPKEIDIIVASLGNSLDTWSKRIEAEELPDDFDQDIAENLFFDILATYDKFLTFQNQMTEDLEEKKEELPENVLEFPRGNR